MENAGIDSGPNPYGINIENAGIDSGPYGINAENAGMTVVLVLRMLVLSVVLVHMESI